MNFGFNMYSPIGAIPPIGSPFGFQGQFGTNVSPVQMPQPPVSIWSQNGVSPVAMPNPLAMGLGNPQGIQSVRLPQPNLGFIA